MKASIIKFTQTAATLILVAVSLTFAFNVCKSIAYEDVNIISEEKSTLEECENNLFMNSFITVMLALLLNTKAAMKFGTI